MQGNSVKEKMNRDFDLYPVEELSGDFEERLRIMEEFESEENLEEDEDEDEDEEGEEEEEEEFSFVLGGDEAAGIAAEDAFSDGQIKTVFPLFDQSLLFSGSGDLPEYLPMRPPVKKVFVETKEQSGKGETSSTPVNDEIVGPYCDWKNRKAVAVEASPESCKKSNSTGFSKIWRLRELTARSNSDGRDAFVFLNGTHAPPPPAAKAVEKPAASTDAGHAAVKTAVKVKKSGKSTKTAAASAHEVYLRSKAKEEERRRSYLPYRPELMGFFTNVNGGLTRNVHPF